MKKLIDKLNKNQKAAVLHTNGPLAIIAGAGSGKTRTLTTKIAYLMKDVGIEPKKILAVTFTNKAANEMKERVIALAGEEAKQAQISTYHSLCVKILRKEISILGFPKNFNILDDIDQKQILSPIYEKYKCSPKTFSYKTMIAYISNHKIQGVSPEEVLKAAHNDSEKICANIYGDYIIETKRSKALDFDDLLIFVHRLFHEHPEVVERWSKVYEYILVDEFQDTSYTQYEIIKKLSGNNNITIVGDPDQTIYTWRHADANLINNFKKYFKGAAVVKLEQNYRSTETILRASNKLIENNKNRIPKKLFSDKGEGEIIEFHHGFSDDSEARWIVSKIQELKKQKNQLKEIAILYRANYISQSIERNLINAGINYAIYGGMKFYQRQEIKDAISYLKIINNGDETSLRRMINVPSRKIGAAALSKLVKFSEGLELPLYEAITKHFKTAPLTNLQRQGIAKLFNLFGKYRAALKSNSISLVLDKFLQEIKYLSIWKVSEDQSRFENIKQLINSISDWEKENKDKTLDDYIQEISLYIDANGDSRSKDFVSLMTVHTSKGLEFDNVFIAGFAEGVFPSQRALDEGKGGLEEERRLAYVAVTRARNKVFISDSRGYSIDHKTQKKPSRFIKELGIDIRKFTTEFIAPKSFEENYSEQNMISGDIVSHITFGEGTVVNVAGDLIDIAFKDPHGVKTLMRNHKSIKRLG